MAPFLSFKNTNNKRFAMKYSL